MIKMDWIYCKDEMPSNNADVLFCVAEAPGNYVYCGYYSSEEWRSNDGYEYVFEREDIIYAWAYVPAPAPLPEITERL